MKILSLLLFLAVANPVPAFDPFSLPAASLAESTPPSASSAAPPTTIVCGVDPWDIAGISAQSACLMEAETGTILYAKDANTPRGIASTTKILTGLLAAEYGALDESFPVPKDAVGVEGTSMYLQAGQNVTMRDLLHGLMLQSGNDAAVAIALRVGGNLDAFAEMMNARATAIGMTGSHFVTPNGLTAEGHHSTARDMALLTREALQNPVFNAVVGTKFYKFGDRTIKNHNKMLWNYEGADGVKTGFTKAAGRCLVSSATRNGLRLIAVTLNDGDDWRDHTAMFDSGFAKLASHVALTSADPFGAIPVYNGENTIASLNPTQTIKILTTTDKNLSALDSTVPRYLWPPCADGDTVGEVRVVWDGNLVATVPLTVTLMKQ